MPDDGELTEARDVAALAAAASGGAGPFEALVRRHHDAVFRFALWLTGSESTAEDVLQETFLAAYRHAAQFRAEARVRTWLFTITRRLAARTRRRRAGEPAALEPLESLGEAAGWGGPDPERAATDVERREALRAALGRLAPEEREILVLRELEGFTGPEAAEILGLTLAAAKTRLHRARLRLMAALREGGIDGP